MKNLKVNFIALVALVIGIVTMSFKIYPDKSQEQSGWYEVESDGTLSPSPTTPPNEIDCSTLMTTDLCKIFWPEDSSPPEDVEDVLDLFPDTPKAGRVQ